MSNAALSTQVKATMQKVAKSVADVKILGRFIHVSYTNAADSKHVREMLAAMSGEVLEMTAGRDGKHLDGFKGHRMVGRA